MIHITDIVKQELLKYPETRTTSVADNVSRLFAKLGGCHVKTLTREHISLGDQRIPVTPEDTFENKVNKRVALIQRALLKDDKEHVKMILAINNIGFIGLNGGLPWKCREDLQYFKTVTDGSRLIVGYRTAQSLPPLKGRELVVDSREGFVEGDWCIGGKNTYEKYASRCTELHVSIIDDNTKGDTLIPDLSGIDTNKCVIIRNYFTTDTPDY